MFGEVCARPRSGGDGNGARAESFAASNVARGVANHIGFFRRKFAAMFFPGARSRETAEFVAVMVIIGKCAEFKKMPDAVVLELELRAARDISGQKREDKIRAGFQAFEQLEDAGKKCAFPARQFLGKKVHVTVEKSADVFVRFRDLVLFQDADDDAGVGHARDLDIAQVVFNAEAFGQNEFERFHARAGRGDKRSVDVEEEEALRVLISRFDVHRFRRLAQINCGCF